MIQREALKFLRSWRTDTHRKPLVLRGARQVGKTTIINEFAREFDNYLYLNMELTEDRRPLSSTSRSLIPSTCYLLVKVSLATRVRH